MAYLYLGLDLGQSADYTALAVLEEQLWCGSEVDFDGFDTFIPDELRGGWVSPTRLTPRNAQRVMFINYHFGRPPHPPVHVRHLQRFELGTRYTEIVARVKRMRFTSPLRERADHVRLLIDKTGVGAAVVDGFKAAGIRPISVTIHGGADVTTEFALGGGPVVDGYRVPKRDLVAACQVLLQNGRLRIAEGLPLADTLKKELLNFRVKIDPKTAHDSYSHWREQDHDDLVLAVAMAAWLREFNNRELEKRNARQGGYRVRSANRDLGQFGREPQRYLGR